MTERDWLESAQPEAMLRQVRAWSVHRHRFFACACCRRIWPMLQDVRSQRAVQAAEAYAEGRIAKAELLAAHAAARAAESDLAAAWRLWAPAHTATATVTAPIRDGAREVSCVLSEIAVAEMRGSQFVGQEHAAMPEHEARAQRALLHDIFGNPFCSLAGRPFTAHVVQLAQSIADGDCGCYPVLADALADVGEETAATHCQEAYHVKGCYVITWILRKR